MSTVDSVDLTALAAQLAAITDPVAAARAQLAKPVPMRHWADLYLTDLAKRVAAGKYSPHTLAAYTSTINLFVAWVEDHDSLVTSAIVEGFLESRRSHARTVPGGSGNTFNRHRSTLRSMFDWLVIRVVETGCPPIYRDQVRGIEEAVKPKSEAHPLAVGDWLSMWNGDLSIDERFWLGMLYYTGLRKAEVSSLRVKHIQITGPVERRYLVDITRKGRGERKIHSVPYGLMARTVAKHYPDTVGRHVGVWLQCVEHVVATRGPDPEALVCVRTDDRDQTSDDRHSWVNDDLAKLLARFEVAEHYKPHDFRDSANTNLERCGVPQPDRMRWLNHADAKTNNLYTAQDDERLIAALEV